MYVAFFFLKECMLLNSVTLCELINIARIFILSVVLTCALKAQV